MNKTTEVLKLALDALVEADRYCDYDEALAAIREVLADQFPDTTKMVAEQEKQEPVAYVYEVGVLWKKHFSIENPKDVFLAHKIQPLYAAPVSAKREWVELTVSDLDAIIEKHYDDEMDLKTMILDGIAAFKEKNK